MPNSASIISASRLVVVLLVLADLQQQHQCQGNSDIDLSGFVNAQAPEIHLQLQPSCAAKGFADADADGSSHAAREGSSSSSSSSENTKDNESSTESSQHNTNDQVGTCSLYIAPSTIDHVSAGLGLFAGHDISKGSFVGEEELYVAIQDTFKTLPYRGQHRFLSWLGYVWPSEVDSFWHMTDESFPTLHPSHYKVDDGLNAAEGLSFYDHEYNVIDAFVPGIASLVNSNPQQANLDRSPTSRRVDDSLTRSTTKSSLHHHRYTPYHGVRFEATDHIPAGTELFLDYGSLWHERLEEKFEGDGENGYVHFEETPQEYMPGKNISIPSEEEKRAKRGPMERQLQQSLLKKFRADLMKDAHRRTAAKKGQGYLEQDITNNGTHLEESVTLASTTTTTASATNDDSSTTLVETKVTVETTTTTLTPLNNDSGDSDDEEEEDGRSTPKFDIGTIVYEEFEEDEWFFGTITDYDAENDEYEVVYSDGDELYYNGETQRDELMEMIQNAKEELAEVKKEQIERQWRERRLNRDFRRLKEEENQEEESDDYDEEDERPVITTKARTMEWLMENGVCIDNLRSGNSTIPGAGRGAFAKRFIAEGGLVAPAPLIVLKRDDLVIYEADETSLNMKEVLNFDKIVGYELLMNYCYGRPGSPLLLLPIAPGVNFINHNGNAPNAVIRWPSGSSSSLFRDAKEWLDLHPLDLIDQSGKLMMEFVALRDIQPGDEITIDYGQSWQAAWDSYMQSSNTTNTTARKAKPIAGFRHEIGVPPSFFPEKWDEKAIYELANQEVPLKAGEIDELRWKHNGERVAEGLVRVGLPEGFSTKMREYAEERGITGLYDRLITDTYLENDGWHVVETIDGEHWFVHRYRNTIWKFNMHYVGAWDEVARQSIFRALSKAGFDDALDGLGKHFGYDNMTCFHFSFMGLSQADSSFTHADVYASGKKGFNLIFPIITVKGSKPELDIISENANIELPVNYKDDVAYVLADWGYHKTSANDNEGGQLRLVASLYCGQIDETNAEMMAHIYDGEDPAPFMSQFDLPIKEYHWGNGHKLPE